MERYKEELTEKRNDICIELMWHGCHNTFRMIIVPLFSLPMNTEAAGSIEDAILKLVTVGSILRKLHIWVWKKGFSLEKSFLRTIYQLLSVQRRSHWLNLCVLTPLFLAVKNESPAHAVCQQVFKHKFQAWICQEDSANSTGSMTSLVTQDRDQIHTLSNLPVNKFWHSHWLLMICWKTPLAQAM